MSREMFLYPWDVLDNGINRIAEDLQSFRIQSVSVAAVYHQARMLLPHDLLRRLVIHPSGTCYIPFKKSRYTSLMPRSPSREYLGLWDSLRRNLSDRGIGMTAWMVLMHNSWLSSAHPEWAITNVFGDHLPSNLCPSHPEVQDYACNLVDDLKESGVEQLDAESLDFAGFVHGDHHEMHAYADVAQLNRWLGLCFCDACQARAKRKGIDTERLMIQIRAAAEAFLRLEPVCAPDAALLAAYDDMRCEVINQLYRRMKEEGGMRIRPILWLGGGADPLQSGIDAKRMELHEAVVCYPDQPGNVDAFLERVRSLVPESTRITGGIRLMSPQTVHAQQGPEYEERYKAAGVNRVIYYNYGMAPRPMLDALVNGAEDEA